MQAELFPVQTSQASEFLSQQWTVKELVKEMYSLSGNFKQKS
jgi:hypothetical protein